MPTAHSLFNGLSPLLAKHSKIHQRNQNIWIFTNKCHEENLFYGLTKLYAACHLQLTHHSMLQKGPGPIALDPLVRVVSLPSSVPPKLHQKALLLVEREITNALLDGGLDTCVDCGVCQDMYTKTWQRYVSTRGYRNISAFQESKIFLWLLISSHA